MKRLMVFLVAIVGGVMIQGCATSLSSNQYTVDILTNQPNQGFKIYNRKGQYVHQGKTPMLVTLKSQSEFFTREIYTVKTDSGKSTKLTATYSPFYWGNVFGFIGFAFDGITGAMWSLPSKLNIDKGENQDDWIDRL